MPLMCKDMVELLDPANSSSVNHTSLSDYAFLYGIFPTAPSVAIYAAQYNMQLEVVSFTLDRLFDARGTTRQRKFQIICKGCAVIGEINRNGVERCRVTSVMDVRLL